MMKKRIALLGLLGCMALCSERVQAVTVFFDGQTYELSEGDYERYKTVSRVRKTGGDTQQKADGRVRELLAKLDDQIVKPSVAPTSTVASKTTMAPPVPAAPTQAQLDAAAARRAAAGMPVTSVHATAASAAAAQADEHEALSAGEKRALGLAGYGEAQVKGLDRTIRTQGRSAENVQEALRKANIAMRAAGNESSTRGLLNSSDSPMRGPRGFSNADLDAMYARQLQEEEQQRVGVAPTNPDEEADLNAAIMASMQSKSPALSTGSVTPPAVAAEENVRPHDEQYTEVMVVQPVGMSDDVWGMVKGGDMTIDEATEYLLVMEQAEREAAEAAEAAANQAAIRLAQVELEREEEAANQAAMRAAQVDLEEQEEKAFLRREAIINACQDYIINREILSLTNAAIVELVKEQLALNKLEEEALKEAFKKATQAEVLAELQKRLTR